MMSFVGQLIWYGCPSVLYSHCLWIILEVKKCCQKLGMFVDSWKIMEIVDLSHAEIVTIAKAPSFFLCLQNNWEMVMKHKQWCLKTKFYLLFEFLLGLRGSRTVWSQCYLTWQRSHFPWLPSHSGSPHTPVSLLLRPKSLKPSTLLSLIATK